MCVHVIVSLYSSSSYRSISYQAMCDKKISTDVMEVEVDIVVEWYSPSTNPESVWPDHHSVSESGLLSEMTPLALMVLLVPRASQTKKCTIWRDTESRGSATGVSVIMTSADANRPLSFYKSAFLPSRVEFDDA